jgi:hypothetical protein
MVLSTTTDPIIIFNICFPSPVWTVLTSSAWPCYIFEYSFCIKTESFETICNKWECYSCCSQILRCLYGSNSSTIVIVAIGGVNELDVTEYVDLPRTSLFLNNILSPTREDDWIVALSEVYDPR